MLTTDFSTLAHTVMIPSALLYLQAFTNFVTMRLRLNLKKNSEVRFLLFSRFYAEHIRDNLKLRLISQ